MGDRHLVAAEDLMSPSVEATIAALDPPPQDAALVQAARMAAKGIDRMEPALRSTMFPQHAGILLRALRELDERARKRRNGPDSAGKGVPSRLEQMRAARAADGSPKRAR
jgi:hypothetical protein